MGGQHGTKETKEAMKGVLALVEFVIERLYDGAGFDDVVAAYSKFTSDDVFKKKLKAAWEDKELVSKELSELDNEDIMELGMSIAPDIIALLGKMKK